MKKIRRTLKPINEVSINEAKKLRIRRVLQLANNCRSNIAFYKTNWHKNENDESTVIVNRDFWIRANGNFLDIAVLEWCKVFSEKRGEHHWTKIFKSKYEWMSKFLAHMKMSQKEFHAELQKITKYRNKYIAHLDPIPLKYPKTDIMLKSMSYLYDEICNDMETKSAVRDYGLSALDVFIEHLKYGKAEVEFAEKFKNKYLEILYEL